MSVVSATENSVLMTQARQALKGRWGEAIGATVVSILIPLTAQMVPRVGGLLSFLISGPIMVGLAGFFLTISRKQEPVFSQIFAGFRKFRVSLGAYLFQCVFVLLWMLLLIIPGIVAALSYAMTYYIISENEAVGPLAAIAKSKAMMRGNRWKFFCLGCRFLGWAVLSLLTLGIGFLWLLPYMNTAFAQFYDDLTPTAAEIAGSVREIPGPAAND